MNGQMISIDYFSLLKFKALEHFFMGVVICLAVVLISRSRKTRRGPFRFNGEHRLGFGSRNSWIMWFTIALVFEIVISFLPGFSKLDGITEVALSVWETPFLVIGLFLVDRIAIWFEPESHFKAIPTNSIQNDQVSRTTSSSSTARPVTNEIKPSVLTDQTVPQIEEKSAIAERINGVSETITNGAADVAGTLIAMPSILKEAVDRGREQAAVRREADEKKRAEESENRRSRLKDSLKNH